MIRTWPERPRALMSYAYLRGVELPTGIDIVIDSGAFTVASTGMRIDIDNYSAFLAERAGQFTFALALDVIRDPEASWRNYVHQRESLNGSNVTLVPTWHLGSPIAELERLCEATDLVAIGGAVGTHAVPLMRLAVEAHRVAAKRGTRFHGLGITSASVLRLPWFSVDSSSWSFARRQPLLYLTAQGGRVRSLSRGNPLSAADTALVQSYGLNPGQVSSRTATRGPNGRELLNTYTVAMLRSYMELERWGSQPRVYLACQPVDIPIITTAHRLGSPYVATFARAVP